MLKRLGMLKRTVAKLALEVLFYFQERPQSQIGRLVAEWVTARRRGGARYESGGARCAASKL